MSVTRALPWLAMIALIAVACSSDTEPPGTVDSSTETIGDLVLTGPFGDDVGLAPVFEWDDVDGADRYRLVLLDATGFPIWSWEGEATAVPMLGFEHGPDSGGQVVLPGSTWSVAALDADRHVLALSQPARIDPGVEVGADPLAADRAAALAASVTTTTLAGPAEVPSDVCRLLFIDDVAPFFGGNAPPPLLEELADGTILCRITDGTGTLELAAVASGDASAAPAGCSSCVAVDLGDDAAGQAEPGRSIVVVLTGGVRWSLEATDLGDVAIDDLAAVVGRVLDRA